MLRGPRKISVKVQGRPGAEINVTPLVDVVLVLLIIFMVVTPLLEKDLPVRVPEAEQLTDDTRPLPDQLVVSVDRSGGLKLNAEPLAQADYVERLRLVLGARPQGKRVVFFFADGQTGYGTLVTAIDGARLAGAELLGMMIEPPAATGP